MPLACQDQMIRANSCGPDPLLLDQKTWKYGLWWFLPPLCIVAELLNGMARIASCMAFIICHKGRRSSSMYMKGGRPLVIVSVVAFNGWLHFCAAAFSHRRPPSLLGRAASPPRPPMLYDVFLITLQAWWERCHSFAPKMHYGQKWFKKWQLFVSVSIWFWSQLQLFAHNFSELMPACMWGKQQLTRKNM